MRSDVVVILVSVAAVIACAVAVAYIMLTTGR